MALPLLPGLRELPPAPRQFLSFSAINVISWQCLVGPILVLLGRFLEMPPALVGVLLSFLPLSMVLVVGTVPLVEWLGPRRLLTWGWVVRNLLAATIFAIPWALNAQGKSGAWLILFLATLGFCVIRALSVGGWFPWIHEVVPHHQMGIYFATETALAQVSTILVVLGSAVILNRIPGLTGFLIIYGLGIGAGMYSVIVMQRIPGGARRPPHPCPVRVSSYGPVRGDHAFRRFILGSCCCLALLTALSSVSVMYLRDILGYSDTRIMFLLGAASLAVALVINLWGRRADRRGTNQVLLELLIGHSLFALGWLALLPGHRWTGVLAATLVVGSTVGNAAFATVAAQGMLGRVRMPGRVGYTNIWIIASSVATGVVPILTGLLIDRWELNGFRLCFLIAGLGGLLAAFVLSRSPARPLPDR